MTMQENKSLILIACTAGATPRLRQLYVLVLGAEAKCFFFEILEMTGTWLGNHRHEARGSETGLPPLTGCRVRVTGTPAA